MNLTKKLGMLSVHPSHLQYPFNTQIYMYKNRNPESGGDCTDLLNQENKNILLLLSAQFNTAIKKAGQELVVFTLLVHMLSEQICLKCQQIFGRILPDIFEIAMRLPITTLHESQGRGLSKHSPLNSTTKTPPNHLN